MKNRTKVYIRRISKNTNYWRIWHGGQRIGEIRKFAGTAPCEFPFQVRINASPDVPDQFFKTIEDAKRYVQYHFAPKKIHSPKIKEV